MKCWKLAVAVAAVFVIVTPEGLDSCGIAPPAIVFAAKTGPGNPKAFRAGHVGVIRRSYKGTYLVAAYRILSGVPLTDAEAAPIMPRFLERDERYQQPDAGRNWFVTPGRDAWQDMRTKLAGAGPMPPLDTDKVFDQKGEIHAIHNCLDDAFANATSVLTQLDEDWGAADPRTTDWVRAQDQVFRNCSEKQPTIPEAPAPGMDVKLARHRLYQIAAAHFYAGQFRQASETFDAIARDAESPWKDIAPYLAGRSLLRAGLIDGDMAAFREAKDRLMKVANDPEPGGYQEDSLNLIHLWQLRVEPTDRMQELSSELMQPEEKEKSQAVIDFLYTVRRELDAADSRQAERVTEVEKSNPMAAWVMGMTEKPPADSCERALEWWHKTGKSMWLIPAVASWDEKSRDELLQAAGQVKADDPAWESIAYYTTAAEITHGHVESGRQWADRALGRKLEVATRNLILDQRAKLARGTVEYLQLKMKQPEPFVVYYDGDEEPATPKLGWATSRVLDGATVKRFNYEAPLAEWLEASAGRTLPTDLRLRIAECGWVRALILGRPAEARTFLERVAELSPAAAGLIRPILEAKSPEESRFATAYLCLRVPDLSPLLAGGDHRTPDLATARYYRANWSYFDGEDDGTQIPYLSAAQSVAAQAEEERLNETKLWSLDAWLQETVAWAATHPDDPRVPEALHRGVFRRNTSPDPAGPNYAKAAKAAFELLHTKYPKSIWTAKTPYWYN